MQICFGGPLWATSSSEGFTFEILSGAAEKSIASTVPA